MKSYELILWLPCWSLFRRSGAAAFLVQADDFAVVVHGFVGRERNFEVLDGFGVGGDDDGLILFEDGVDECDVFILPVVVAVLEGQCAMRFGDGEAGAFDIVESAVHRIDADAVFAAAAADEAA